jgi:hypothetical protein
MLRTIIAASVASAALVGCSQTPKAPEDTGVCYHVAHLKSGEYKFNVVARDQPRIEECAARIEELRLKFRRMGAGRTELTGAYQGRYLFVNAAGVSFAQSLEGGRFQALTRLPDGRLVIPGAIANLPPGATAQ